MFIDSHFLGTGIEWHRREAKTADFAPAAKRLRAIDLSCRACGAGAGCWAWIPGRGTFGFHPQPPITYVIAYVVTYAIAYGFTYVITYVIT